MKFVQLLKKSFKILENNDQFLRKSSNSLGNFTVFKSKFIEFLRKISGCVEHLAIFKKNFIKMNAFCAFLANFKTFFQLFIEFIVLCKNFKKFR
jgi:hypothetical protein